MTVLPARGQSDEHEVTRDATIAIVVVVALQSTLAVSSMLSGWDLWGLGLPGWAWFVAVGPELALFATLTLHIRRHGTEQMGRRRKLSLALTGTVASFNMLALAVLIGALLSNHEHNGAALLLKAVTIWVTNVVAFGLLFWDVDAGGPIARLRSGDVFPDFLFPQMQIDDPKLVPRGWRARLVDYAYVSFTNSIAFSPTDTLPLTPRAKALMAVESGVSVTTVLLVAARAVNILD